MNKTVEPEEETIDFKSLFKRVNQLYRFEIV
jgi:hypothetical protein